MTSTIVLLSIALPTWTTGEDRPGDPVADRIALRDGTILLGQVLSTRSTRVEVVVRRSWANQHLPERALAWEDRDRHARERARADRIDRLRRWRDDRSGPPGAPDPTADRLGLELDRLAEPSSTDQTPLMIISIDRRDVGSIDSQPEDRRRMLRQGWRAGFDDVETMPLDRLQAGLQARGFARSEVDPAPIDDLLPIPVESEQRWLARRASTEVLTDPDLRFIRFGGLVLPDPGPGVAVDQARMAGALGNLIGEVLGGTTEQDPLAPHLNRIEASGRVGAVVTGLEIAPGLDRVAVESILVVRTGPSRWEVAARRRSEARPADLPAGAGRELAEDPQVRSAITLLEGLGIGAAGSESAQAALTIGAATQAALEQARSALDADLRSAAIPLDRPGPSQPRP